MARVISLDVKKFVPNPGAPAVAPLLAGVGTINVVAKASLVDNDYFTVDDGEHAPILFEFKITGGFTPTVGRTTIDASAATTAASVRDLVITAINAKRDASLLNLTATNTGAAQVTVTMLDDTPGGTLTEHVADAGFTVSGMVAATGATSYSYKLVAEAADGTLTAVSSAGSTAAGAAALSSANRNHVTWTDALNAVKIHIFRTVGGATQGEIANVLAGVQTYDDTGAVADGATPSAANGTGVGARSGSVLDLVNKYLQVTGTFVATWQLQGSIDGSTWVNINAAITTVGLYAVASTIVFLRLVATAYTSGSAGARLAGTRE